MPTAVGLSKSSLAAQGSGVVYSPDYRKQPFKCFLLGWPALLATWFYIVWFTLRVVELCDQPFERGNRSVVDLRWYRVLLPSVCPPIIFIGFYWSWIGWKFFLHN
ncbi:hypothetical protein TRVL_00044 [Trypanosoma vivax]|uniref:Phosphatidylinositol N-acetylglucosaminyltransferase subunit Y n=1 Tax=Trypanosoma vivax (strain Y486) TaxID=1055687 RepID=G0TTV2_TRYVY|nr:hypothetical protein TRVL_00044 [Trypanosoma vivax]CCC47385.1 conserved hypothetical protein, unlikely [Trypanosoma vivax Y486]